VVLTTREVAAVGVGERVLLHLFPVAQDLVIDREWLFFLLDDHFLVEVMLNYPRRELDQLEFDILLFLEEGR
jgi:hypothetical protein